jgi:hypothetical protein
VRLELLALLLADDDTAVAKIGTRNGNELVPMFTVPLTPLADITPERVLEAVAGFQVKVDALEAVYEACQPKLVTAAALPPNVTAGTFSKH